MLCRTSGLLEGLWYFTAFPLPQPVLVFLSKLSRLILNEDVNLRGDEVRLSTVGFALSIFAAVLGGTLIGLVIGVTCQLWRPPTGPTVLETSREASSSIQASPIDIEEVGHVSLLTSMVEWAEWGSTCRDVDMQPHQPQYLWCGRSTCCKSLPWMPSLHDN